MAGKQTHGERSVIHMRAYRRRMRAGRTLVTIEIDEVLLIDGLVEARLLEPSLSDSKHAIDKAASRFVEIILKEKQSEHRPTHW